MFFIGSSASKVEKFTIKSVHRRIYRLDVHFVSLESFLGTVRAIGRLSKGEMDSFKLTSVYFPWLFVEDVR